jgi:serine/threonine protein kinase
MNKYTIIEQIGRGSFGSIYRGKNNRTGELVAIKAEPIKNGQNLLVNESRVYNYLKNCKGVPTIKWFGKDGVNYYMVINLLGKSLYEMKMMSLLSSSDVSNLIIQAICIIESIHDKGLVHRDIKPDNFLYNNNQLYLIDFGFCKPYIKNGVHDELTRTSGLVGSLNYSSINSHRRISLCRRDDMESLGYVIAFLTTGLEWQDLTKENEIENQKILFTKSLTSDKARRYLSILSGIEYNERPCYESLRNSML